MRIGILGAIVALVAVVLVALSGSADPLKKVTLTSTSTTSCTEIGAGPGKLEAVENTGSTAVTVQFFDDFSCSQADALLGDGQSVTVPAGKLVPIGVPVQTALSYVLASPLGANQSLVVIFRGLGNGWPSPLPTATSTATASPSPSPSPSPTPSATPTGVVNANIEPADQFADSFGVNTSWCKDGTNFGVLTPYSLPTTDPFPQNYLIMSGVRHVRDSLTDCLGSQTNFDQQFTRMHNDFGIDLIGTNYAAYTVAQLAGFLTEDTAIHGIEYQNETDVFTWPSAAALAATTTNGATSFTINNDYIGSYMVPGSIYEIVDPVQSNENFAMGTPIAIESADLTPELQYPHLQGVPIVRPTGAWSYEYDAANWLAWYMPLIEHYDPTYTMYGPSLAFPHNGQNFASVPLGAYINVLEGHDYATPMGANPEGQTGDGSEGYTTGNDGACSNNSGYRYGWNYDTCALEYIAGATNPLQYLVSGSNVLNDPTARPIETTEYSYTVGPINAKYNSSVPFIIPDDVGMKYLARSYFFAVTHNRTRLDWFNLVDGTDGGFSGFCTYGLIRASTCNVESDPAYPSSGNFVPKAEYFTWESLIQFFSDPGCKYPTCTFTPPTLETHWSNPSLPLNQVNLEKSNGQLYIVAWLGAEDYDYTAPSGCRTNSQCYLSVSPVAETLYVPGMVSATIQGLDATSTDPQPSPTPTTASDGATEDVAWCPISNITTDQFGCITPTSTLTVSNAGTSQASVSFNVTDTPQWVMPVFSAGAFPSPSPIATITPNALATYASLSPGAYAGAPTPTLAPPPTPSPTPLPSSTAEPILAYVTQCNSGIANYSDTVTCTLSHTPSHDDTLIAVVTDVGTTKPTGTGNVTAQVPNGFTKVTGPTYTGGNYGETTVSDFISDGNETSVTVLDPVSTPRLWNVTIFDVTSAGTMHVSILGDTGSSIATNSLTPVSYNSLILAQFTAQNGDSGSTVSPSLSLTYSGWTASTIVSTGYSATNNLISAYAYTSNGTAGGFNPLSQTGAFTDSNYSATYGSGTIITIAPTITFGP